MNFNLFKSSLKGMKSEVGYQRMISAGLLVALIVSLVMLSAKTTTTVLVPPSITEKMEVSTSKASGGYKKAWGLFVSQLLGNVTQGNAQFVLDSLETMMVPDVYAQMKKGVMADVEIIKQNALVISFETRRVTFENETGKIFVTGAAHIEGIGASISQQFDKTFEMKFDISNGVPLVSQFDSYKGEPRTLEYLARNRIKDTQ
jgi:conjugal transfer pilus assembly protein TraE